MISNRTLVGTLPLAINDGLNCQAPMNNASSVSPSSPHGEEPPPVATALSSRVSRVISPDISRLTSPEFEQLEVRTNTLGAIIALMAVMLPVGAIALAALRQDPSPRVSPPLVDHPTVEQTVQQSAIEPASALSVPTRP